MSKHASDYIEDYPDSQFAREARANDERIAAVRANPASGAAPAAGEQAQTEQPWWRSAPRETCPCGDGPRPGHPAGWCAPPAPPERGGKQQGVWPTVESAAARLSEHVRREVFAFEARAEALPADVEREDEAWLEGLLADAETAVGYYGGGAAPEGSHAACMVKQPAAEASRYRRILARLRAAASDTDLQRSSPISAELGESAPAEGEPVAWLVEVHLTTLGKWVHSYLTQDAEMVAMERDLIEYDHGARRRITPLYAHPAPAPQPGKCECGATVYFDGEVTRDTVPGAIHACIPQSEAGALEALVAQWRRFSNSLMQHGHHFDPSGARVFDDCANALAAALRAAPQQQTEVEHG